MVTYLNTLFATFSKFSHVGGFSILNEKENLDGLFTDHQPDDIIVYYDYCTDELNETECTEFCDWIYDDAWQEVKQLMINNDYVEVKDQDGSSGGLYYGATLFRKI